MTQPAFAIGIDLGGTNIKAAAVDTAGSLLGARTVATEDRDDGTNPARWSHALLGLIGDLERAGSGSAEAIGLAAPGLAAADRRSIAHMPGRLEGLEGLDWTHALQTPRPVTVLNDAHAALVGEAWTGAAAGLDHAVLFTLGTGVGGACLADGRLLEGAGGRAGHWGHLCLDPGGEPDITGMPGSLEDAVGECSLERRSEGRFRTTRELVTAAAAGDEGARAVWERSVRSLACAVASAINVLDPQAVILGGGAARAGAALFELLEAELDAIEWRPLDRRVPVLPAQLGPLAGAVGAARHATLTTRTQRGRA
ncbi:MAG: ROK family protein [Planctomycetota bacterium]|jgi:glucokinase|nr:ROK family protein [Planctomycetota bacterium]MDP6763667.1 ROK family protein [Planctomycetota bacterium]MDP6987936.1 ROK family protein [Planctomycetota bacterium]